MMIILIENREKRLKLFIHTAVRQSIAVFVLMGLPGAAFGAEQKTTRYADVNKKLYKKITDRNTIRLFKSIVKKER